MTSNVFEFPNCCILVFQILFSTEVVTRLRVVALFPNSISWHCPKLCKTDYKPCASRIKQA